MVGYCQCIEGTTWLASEKRLKWPPTKDMVGVPRKQLGGFGLCVAEPYVRLKADGKDSNTQEPRSSHDDRA